MKPQSFKARDYLFTKGTLAEALLSAGAKPKSVTYSRVPKLAVNGRCISADFKRAKASIGHDATS